MKDPVAGTAQVVSATRPSGDSSWENVRMTLTVRGDGVPPTAVEHRCMCRADRWPSPGDVLPITIDRAKPKRLKVEWGEVESGRARAWEAAEAAAAAERGGATAAEPPAVPGVDMDALRSAFPGATIEVETVDRAGGAADPADRVAILERLAKLHESGALSDAEFEAEKARLLGGG
jgi:hypothetical protein